MSELNIFQRINAVQKKVKYIQKDAQISGGGNYKAVTHDQVVSVIREELVKNGIAIFPVQLEGSIINETTTKSGGKMYLYSGTYAVHFVNIDKPTDEVVSVVNAHANDNGDKAPGKCLTYATKSAILKVFTLETGENDESRTAGDQSYSDAQKERFDDFISLENPSDAECIEYLEFMRGLTERGQVDLVNSGDKGEKMKIKQKAKSISERAWEVIGEYVALVKEAIRNEDECGAFEIVDELTPFEKSMVAHQLIDIEIDWLKTKRENQNK